MKTAEWITIVAIVIGPILAVQIQKWIERYNEKNERMLNIFKTLMATRGARVSFEHVRALNMIDTEFVGIKKVILAWKNYLDCLNSNCENENQLEIWAEKRDNLFVVLLKEMATHLRYDFDDVHLKKAVYTPRAHGQEEADLWLIRDQIKKIFSGEQSISVKLIEEKGSESISSNS
ncbi:DUF6680 family protein [Legionella sp.]|uniref:DUF6680 family protein n=1 Tax=Legionella sp. TaxID=459 RepID=UPI00321F6C27